MTTTTESVVASIMGKRLPWEYKWHPKTRHEMILPEPVEKQVDYQMSTSGLKNCTYHAGPGVGKTTLARLIGKEMRSPVLFYNASQMKVDVLRDEIIPRGQQYIMGPPTLVILDECDKAGSAAFWDALRSAIDATLESMRYILTGNYIYNIPAPILSRCPPVSFEHTDPKIKIPIFNRLKLIAEEETKISGGTYDVETLKIIARKCYPDIRGMIKAMEQVFDRNNGSIIGTPTIGNESHLIEIFNYLKAGKDVEARIFFNDHITDYGTFFSEFCDYTQENCAKHLRLDVGILFAEYQYRATSSVNQELNITRGMFGHLTKMLHNG